MNLDMSVVFINLLELFLLIGVGALCGRARIFPEETPKVFSILLTRITLPCTLFVSLAGKSYAPEFVLDSIVMIAIGLVMFTGLLLLFWFLAGMMKIPEGTRGIWSFCATFSNSGFMGYPIILQLLGEEALALAMMLAIAFNLTIYTLGALAICRDAGGSAGKLDLRGILVSNINIALLLGGVVYFARIPVPEAVLVPVRYLGNITTPLSMLVVGLGLSGGNVRSLLKEKKILTGALMRLLICPLLVWGVLSPLPLRNPLTLPVLVITQAMPAPGTASVLTELYGGNKEFASKFILLTNILCLLTIPGICLLL